MKIYTKTGDKGLTSLYTGARLEKSDIIFDSIGMADELNSYIGLIASLLTGVEECIQVDYLRKIQLILFEIGTNLATPNGPRYEQTRLDPEYIPEIEHNIDILDSQIPRLKNFVIPGSGVVNSHIHVARTICRRLERHLYTIPSVTGVPDYELDKNLCIYVNRLSDYLFTFARCITYLLDDGNEVLYNSK